MRIKHEVSKIISEDIQNGENIEMIVSLLLKEARKVGELLPKSSDYDKIAEKIKKSQSNTFLKIIYDDIRDVILVNLK